MRICVCINPWLPLIAGAFVRSCNGPHLWISFRYEQVYKFCRSCGHIGYTFPHCIFDNANIEAVINNQMLDIQDRLESETTVEFDNILFLNYMRDFLNMVDGRTSRVIYNELEVDDFVPAAQEVVPPPNAIFEDVREDELLELEEVLKGHALEEPPPRNGFPVEVFGSLSHLCWIDNFTKSDLGDKGKVGVSNTNEPKPDVPLGGIVVERNYQPLFDHLSSDSPHQAAETVNTEDNLGLRTISGQVGGEVVEILKHSTRDNATNVLITTFEVSQITDHIIDDVMANATNGNVFDDEDGIHSTFHNHFNSIFCEEKLQSNKMRNRREMTGRKISGKTLENKCSSKRL
ncbi:hypothetical protein Goari_024962 [Gossypium aridum]|uniref:Zinc knuckle CX2CX4HX4C domain-containing protein n=1 Tax=Gossypium aridum TaxID=34290 RepID=A0A7J8X8N8_GOSAI|nr:hypothetical protein [Gossypium aridum]